MDPGEEDGGGTQPEKAPMGKGSQQSAEQASAKENMMNRFFLINTFQHAKGKLS